MLVRALPVVGSLIIVGACTLPSSDEFAHGSDPSPPPSPEAGADASPRVGTDGGGVGPSDAATVFDTGADGGVIDPGPVTNILTPDESMFENGNCGMAGTFESTLEGSSTAHTGSGSCEVCRSVFNGDGTYTIDTFPGIASKTGQQFQSLVWVRRVPGDTSSRTISLALRSSDDGASNAQEADSDAVTLTDDWQQLYVVIDVKRDRKFLDTFVVSNPPKSQQTPCFLVDDWLLWETK